MAPSQTSFIKNNVFLPPSRLPSLFDFVSVVLLALEPPCWCCGGQGGLSETLLHSFVTTLLLVIIRITLDFVMFSIVTCGHVP